MLNVEKTKLKGIWKYFFFWEGKSYNKDNMIKIFFWAMGVGL